MSAVAVVIALAALGVAVWDLARRPADPVDDYILERARQAHRAAQEKTP